MKKKKIIIPILIAVLLISLITINVEKANAGEAMCSYTAIYYSHEAINSDRTGETKSKNETIYDDNGINSSDKIEQGTVQDCIDYVNTINSARAGEAGCSIDEYGTMRCDNKHVNGGSLTNGGLSSRDAIIDEINARGVEAGCQDFVNGLVSSETKVKDAGKDEASGRNKGEISRDYDPDSGKDFWTKDGPVKSSFEKHTRTYLAPCDQKVEEEKNCTCPGGSGGGGGGGSMTTCGGTTTTSINGCENGSVPAESTQNPSCNKKPSIGWTVRYTITETITVSVNITPNVIYAGGGVGIAISHNSSTSTSINCIEITTNEHIPQCRDGYTLGSDLICRKTVRTKKDNCDPKKRNDCYYDEVYEEGANCTTSPLAPIPGEAYKEAMAAARAAASGAGGGGGPQKITLYARESNDETDKNSYDLSTNVKDQGVAMSSSVGNKTIVGNTKTDETTGNTIINGDSMGTGIGMASSINKACINRRTAHVRYVTGNCNDDEVDGGNKYYIPLKYAPTDIGLVVDKRKGIYYFNFNIKSDNISTISTVKLDGMCKVKVNQKLYVPDPDPTPNPESLKTYNFIYRPVDITNPTITVFPNRTPASNWTKLRNTANAEGNGAYDQVMKRDRIEYSATLDAQAIQSIKNKNNELIGQDKYYNSFKTINNDGTSNVLFNELGIQNNPRHNKLGECNRKTYTIENGTATSNTIPEGTECW